METKTRPRPYILKNRENDQHLLSEWSESRTHLQDYGTGGGSRSLSQPHFSCVPQVRRCGASVLLAWCQLQELQSAGCGEVCHLTCPGSRPCWRGSPTTPSSSSAVRSNSVGLSWVYSVIVGQINRSIKMTLSEEMLAEAPACATNPLHIP